MFKSVIESYHEQVRIIVDGVEMHVPPSFTAAVAVLSREMRATRTTPVLGEPRAPYCMMGVCFECLMEINGMPNQQACLIPVAEGMRINFQDGAREVRR